MTPVRITKPLCTNNGYSHRVYVCITALIKGGKASFPSVFFTLCLIKKQSAWQQFNSDRSSLNVRFSEVFSLSSSPLSNCLLILYRSLSICAGRDIELLADGRIVQRLEAARVVPTTRTAISSTDVPKQVREELSVRIQCRPLKEVAPIAV